MTTMKWVTLNCIPALVPKEALVFNTCAETRAEGSIDYIFYKRRMVTMGRYGWMIFLTGKEVHNTHTWDGVENWIKANPLPGVAA